MSQFEGMHEDYIKVPSINLRFNRLMIGLLNGMMRWANWRGRKSLSADIVRENLSLHSDDGRGRFQVISFRPKSLPTNSPAPALVYFHGGAFAMTYSIMHMQFCERYALETGCQVYLVAYRLMPKHPFPAGFNDCCQTVQWLRANALEQGVDAANIAVGGDSAGGAMAATVAQWAQDKAQPLQAQLLIYPVIDHRCVTESASTFEKVPLWNAVSNRRMWDAYLRNVSGDLPAYAAAMSRNDLSALPPAYVETAEFDPLRDEGIAYAKALKAAGVEVQLRETAGTIHGYEMSSGNPVTEESMRARVAFLKNRLHGG